MIAGMCPKGDDPLTPYTDYRTILITVDQRFAAPTSGSYKFTFNGQSVALPTAPWTDQQCQKTFSELSNVEDVVCGVNRRGRFNGYTILLQFLRFPSIPVENNIFVNDGNPPLYAFHCSSTGISTVGQATCTISDIDVSSLPGEYMILALSVGSN